MSAFTCILPHDNNTGAQECPRLYLRGTHRWMFDRPDWLMCIFKPLSGSIQKAANYLHEKHPSCLSPAATLWLSHRRFASASADSLRQRSAVAASGAVWVGERKMPVAAVLPLSLPVTSYFPMLGQWTDVQLKALIKERTYIVCLLLLACVIPAQLWLSDFTTLSVSNTKKKMKFPVMT